MCGIAGVAGGASTLERLADIAKRMGDSLAHRGPDDSDVFVDERGPLALAHRRLAIIDLSPAGHQPMTCRSGRWTIVFNGEIYNHLDLRADLAHSGAQFRGRSDTETLVEAIDAWGIDRTLQRTNGMFALAVWDRHERRLVLARDRLGEKPLYWRLHEGMLSFGSELRAIRAAATDASATATAADDGSLEIDASSVAALLRWSFIPHPHTIYAGVHQLPPGTLLDVDLSNGVPVTHQRTWWSLGDTIDESLQHRADDDIDRAADELEALLTDSLTMRLQADVPLGAFLSGGIDSSLLAALAQRAAGGSLRTFTVRMPDVAFDESDHAAFVARHLGTDHHTIDLSHGEVMSIIPELGSVYDEPFGDPSMLPTTLLCRAVREHTTVCLGGDGGDELFAGYNRHALGASIAGRAEFLPPAIRRAVAAALLAPSPSAVDRVAAVVSKVLPAHRRLPNMGDKVQKAGALIRSDGSAWESLAQIWPAASLGSAAHGPAVPTLRSAHSSVEEMMLVDTAAVLPDQMLVKVDRASMAASLEVRVPFLDHRILEWAWRQPMSLKTSGGVGKLVLRRLAERELPTEVTSRPKMGFDPPLGTWLRGELRPWADDLLSSSAAVANGWLDGAELSKTWREHVEGRRNWDYRLWSVLMLESWIDHHR